MVYNGVGDAYVCAFAGGECTPGKLDWVLCSRMEVMDEGVGFWWIQAGCNGDGPGLCMHSTHAHEGEGIVRTRNRTGCQGLVLRSGCEAARRRERCRRMLDLLLESARCKGVAYSAFALLSCCPLSLHLSSAALALQFTMEVKD